VTAVVAGTRPVIGVAGLSPGMAFASPSRMRGGRLRDVQLAARHGDPRTTTIYDHRRQSFDRHAA
jgi:hypothetical protein